MITKDELDADTLEWLANEYERRGKSLLERIERRKEKGYSNLREVRELMRHELVGDVLLMQADYLRNLL